MPKGQEVYTLTPEGEQAAKILAMTGGGDLLDELLGSNVGVREP